MKKLIMEIAQVLNEDDFYKKYPTQKAFMAKHGATFKKALKERNVPKAQWGAIQGLDTNLLRQQIEEYKNSPTGSQTFDYSSLNSKDGILSKMKGMSASEAAPYLSSLTDIAKGFSMIKEQKNALKKAKQDTGVTGVQAYAAALRPEQIERDYLRPEEMLQPIESFTNPFGAGTNILAKKGAKIPKAQFGQLVNPDGVPDAGSTIGGGILGGVGQFFGGPIGGFIGKNLGQAIGGVIDQSDTKRKSFQDQTNRNINSMMASNFSNNLQSQYGAFAEHGKSMFGGDLVVGEEGRLIPISDNPYSPSETGMIEGPSHENGGTMLSYGGNPVEAEREPVSKDRKDNLVIFGDIKMNKEMAEMIGDPKAKGKTMKRYMENKAKEENKVGLKIEALVRKASDKDPLDKFDALSLEGIKYGIQKLDGDLQLIAETKDNLSSLQSAIDEVATQGGFDSKALIEKGQIKKAKGGTSISFAKNGILQKPERKPTKEEQYKNWLNRQQAVDSKQMRQAFEAHWNQESGKRERQSTTAHYYRAKPIYDSYMDYLKRKEIQSNPSAYINESPETPMTYDEFLYNVYRHGITDAWKPAFKDWYYNAYNKKSSSSTSSTDRVDKTNDEELIEISSDSEINVPTKSKAPPIITTTKSSGSKKTTTPASSDRMDPLTPLMKPKSSGQVELPKWAKKREDDYKLATIDDHDEYLQGVKEKFNKDNSKNSEWFDMGMMALNQLMPYIRPSDAEELDPRNIAGELHTLATDKLEPVQAQLYYPQLKSPYEVSLQDMLNENTASFRATERLVANNPAALASLSAQKYMADQKVLAEQFRLNQAERERVYSGNIDTMNQAQMTNLGLLDQQMVRQETAKSTSKENIRNAHSSIASKYLQNQLENRQLKAYENLYNFRFGDDMIADNYNPLQIFSTYSDEPSYKTAKGREVLYSKTDEGDYVPHSIVSKKGAKNGSLVTALKNM